MTLPTALEAASGRPKRSPSVAALVVCVGISCALHVGKLPIAIPRLQVQMQLDLIQAGLLLSMVQCAGMALGLLVGQMADRHGPRLVMLWGLLLLALGSTLGALAGGATALLVTRAVEGCGFLLAVLPAPALLRQHLSQPHELSRALGWWGTYMPSGIALALLFGLPVMNWVDWRGVWLLLSLLSLLSAWALSRVLPQREYTPVQSQTKGLAGPLADTLRSKGAWLVAGCFFFYSGQWLAVVGFLPTIFAQRGLNEVYVGPLGALVAAANIVGNVLAGRWLSRGAGPGRLLSVGYAAMAMGALVAFSGAGQPLLQYAAVLLFSALGGLIPGTLFGVAMTLAPNRQAASTTVGWMQQLSALGQFLGPSTVAWWVTRVGGWQWTWVVTGACSIIGLWLASQVQLAWSQRKPFV